MPGGQALDRDAADLEPLHHARSVDRRCACRSRTRAAAPGAGVDLVAPRRAVVDQQVAGAGVDRHQHALAVELRLAPAAPGRYASERHGHFRRGRSPGTALPRRAIVEQRRAAFSGRRRARVGGAAATRRAAAARRRGRRSRARRARADAAASRLSASAEPIVEQRQLAERRPRAASSPGVSASARREHRRRPRRGARAAAAPRRASRAAPGSSPWPTVSRTASRSRSWASRYEASGCSQSARAGATRAAQDAREEQRRDPASRIRAIAPRKRARCAAAPRRRSRGRPRPRRSADGGARRSARATRCASRRR